jgi:hypothetical protein
MKKTRTRQKAQEYVEPPEPPKPTLPNDILKAFLDRHIKIEDVPNITQVSDTFLWERGSLERYRVNVWMKENLEGQYVNRNYIGYTWFLHFDRDTDTLTDKTIGRVKEDKKKTKKLNGIANGTERIGKSFR